MPSFYGNNSTRLYREKARTYIDTTGTKGTSSTVDLEVFFNLPSLHILIEVEA